MTNDFRVEGLWLTTGGRIVKPGYGECCYSGSDIMLMNVLEIQNGISISEFESRLKEAKKVMKKRIKNWG